MRLSAGFCCWLVASERGHEDFGACEDANHLIDVSRGCADFYYLAQCFYGFKLPRAALMFQHSLYHSLAMQSLCFKWDCDGGMKDDFCTHMLSFLASERPTERDSGREVGDGD